MTSGASRRRSTFSPSPRSPTGRTQRLPTRRPRFGPTPSDDELARAASEFDTYAELRADIESSLREQLEDELDAAFRAETVDRLVAASNATASGPLVDARARELLNQLGRSLDRRGISADMYLQLTGQTPEQLATGVRDEADRSVARELVLEAAADQLGIEIPDEDVEELIGDQAEL